MKVVSINKSSPVYKHASLDFTNEKIAVSSTNLVDLSLSKEHEKVITLKGRQYKILIPGGYTVPKNFETRVAMKDGKPIIDLTEVLMRAPKSHNVLEMDHGYLKERYSNKINDFFKPGAISADLKKYIGNIGIDDLSKLITALSLGKKSFNISEKDLSIQEHWAYTADELSDEKHDVMYYQLPVPNRRDDYFEFVYYKSKISKSHRIVMIFDDFSIEVSKINDSISIIFYSDKKSGDIAMEYLRGKLEKEIVKLDMVRFVNNIYRHKLSGHVPAIDGYV